MTSLSAATKAPVATATTTATAAATTTATVAATTGNLEPAVVPRTANLLACKQWWRVCFLYGDQQKYYRQLYSKAAAQRLATSGSANEANHENDNASSNSNSHSNNNNCQLTGTVDDYDTVDFGIGIGTGDCDFIAAQLDGSEDADDGIDLGDSNQQPTAASNCSKKQLANRPLFPAKCETSATTPRRSKKLLRSLRAHVKGEGKQKEPKEQKELLQRQQQQSQDEPTQRNAKVTVLDDPFLFGIDADHLGDLIRGKHYNTTDATEHIAKYYTLQLEAEAMNLESPCTAQVLEIIEQSEEELLDEPKPALPPKQKQQRAAPPPPARTTAPPTSAAMQPLTASDLKFLNLSLRQRSLPRSMKPFKDPHDISFTFNELDSSLASTQLQPEVVVGNCEVATGAGVAASSQQESNE